MKGELSLLFCCIVIVVLCWLRVFLEVFIVLMEMFNILLVNFLFYFLFGKRSCFFRFEIEFDMREELFLS